MKFLKLYKLYILTLLQVSALALHAETVVKTKPETEKPTTEKTVQPGDICHVEVETEYYYPGVWEIYSETELICNYWRFLGVREEELVFEEDTNDEYIYDELSDDE